MNNDTWTLGGREFRSRFILGSGKYSLKLIEAAVRDAGAEIITLSVRRANTRDQENILDYIPQGVTLLPNTSGARSAEEAVRIARLARELQKARVDVNYPALDGNPEKDLCAAQFRGLGGGILTFRAGSAERARAVINRLHCACIASNIGDVRTLVLLPSTTIFSKNTDRQKADAGVFEDTVRVSVGIEDAEDLIDDFLTALASAG